MPGYDHTHKHLQAAIPTFLLADVLTFTDEAANPDAAGELQRNSARLVFHDGTAARNLALENGTTALTTNGVVYANSSGLLLATAQGATNSVLTASAGAPSFSATPTVTSLTATSAVIVGTNPASAGNFRAPNSAGGLQFRNAANSADVFAIGVDSLNQIVLGTGNDIQWGRALVGLGGGAAPTFGTIGGSGPATAAQNAWMRVIDPGNAAYWVPVWK